MSRHLWGTAAFLCLIPTVVAAQSGEPPPGQCEVDQVMQVSQEAADVRARNAVEAAVQQTDVKEQSCLPTLSQIGGSITSSLPNFQSVSIEGILSQVRNMACDAATQAIEDTAGSLEAGWEAPYGLGGVSAGTNTNGQSGVNSTSNNAINDYTEDYLNSIESRAGSYVDEMGQRAGNITNVNRSRARQTTTSQEQPQEDRSGVLDNF